MTPEEIREIKAIPLFRDLADEVIVAVSDVGTSRYVKPGDVVFRTHETGDELFIVITGAVRLTEGDVEVAICRPGTYFGELSVIDGRPRSADATVIEGGRLFVVKRSDTLKLLSRFEPLLDDMLRRLAGNLRETNAQRSGLIAENRGIREEAELDRLRSLSQMVAGVAHEINTPIGIVQNAASLVTEMLNPSTIPTLAKDEEAATTLRDLAEACELVQKNISVAARLVQSFKSLSVRQQHEARERVDLVAVVQEALDLYRLKARSSNLQLVSHSDLVPSERSWEGYPGHLTQIVLNLVTNADRYAYPGDRAGTVEVSISEKDGSFELVVRDHGAGIPASHLSRIWDPFFTTGRSSGGTGLGLAIVKNLVTQSLGGSIRVESTEGKGTAFVMRFPRTSPGSEGRS